MTMRDLTPKAMRCGPFNCPSVGQLEDGRLLIVGKRAGDLLEKLYAAGHEVPEFDLAEEEPIVIDPALLDDVPRGWRTIDSAPRDGTRILGYRDGHLIDVIFWSAGNWFSQSNKTSLWAAFPPTHWQPLPLPPTDREGA